MSRMKIRFKSKAIVLDWKTEVCPLHVVGESQVEEFKYLRVLSISQGRMERGVDRQNCSGEVEAVPKD